MHRSSRYGFAGLALGLAVLMTAPAPARADGSEGMGLQAVAEMMHKEAVRGDSGWRNGAATLDASGSGYGISYAGTPQRDAGRGPVMIIGNADGNPVAAAAEAAQGMRMVERR